MKKSKLHKELIEEYFGRHVFWVIVHENEHFMHIRNWLTGAHRVIHK